MFTQNELDQSNIVLKRIEKRMLDLKQSQGEQYNLMTSQSDYNDLQMDDINDKKDDFISKEVEDLVCRNNELEQIVIQLTKENSKYKNLMESQKFFYEKRIEADQLDFEKKILAMKNEFKQFQFEQSILVQEYKASIEMCMKELKEQKDELLQLKQRKQNSFKRANDFVEQMDAEYNQCQNEKDVIDKEEEISKMMHQQEALIAKILYKQKKEDFMIKQQHEIKDKMKFKESQMNQKYLQEKKQQRIKQQLSSLLLHQPLIQTEEHDEYQQQLQNQIQYLKSKLKNKQIQDQSLNFRQ